MELEKNGLVRITDDEDIILRLKEDGYTEVQNVQDNKAKKKPKES